MSDLIDRQVAIDAMSKALERVFPEHRQIAEKCLNALPSAQPERKRGEWIKIIPEEGHGIYRAKCDQCGEYDFFETNYCGNCGADMRGETNG